MIRFIRVEHYFTKVDEEALQVQCRIPEVNIDIGIVTLIPEVGRCCRRRPRGSERGGTLQEIWYCDDSIR